MPKFHSRKESSKHRRLVRQNPVPGDPVLGIEKKAPAKKNTKRWCRGVPGVEHVQVVKPYAETKNMNASNAYKDWLILYCKDCGKELDHYWPSSLWKVKQPNWAQRWYDLVKKDL